MSYQVKIRHSAERSIIKLPKEVQSRIYNLLVSLSDNPRPRGCKKLKGKAYTLSTNSEIYIYNIDNEKTINLTENLMGYDIGPVFSPDGTKIAWESMERDGYESDKNRLFIHDFTTGINKDFS